MKKLKSLKLKSKKTNQDSKEDVNLAEDLELQNIGNVDCLDIRDAWEFANEVEDLKYEY